MNYPILARGSGKKRTKLWVEWVQIYHVERGESYGRFMMLRKTFWMQEISICDPEPPEL